MKYLMSLLLLFLLACNSAYATDLRGRIDTRNPYNGYFHPLPRASVALVDVNGQYVGTYTGGDGFYYFYNVPPGNYVLVINGVKRVPVSIPPQQGFDIPPILF